MCVDINNFYLGTTFYWYEYTQAPLYLFPDHIIEQYYLQIHAENDFVYVEIIKEIYGLPQARVLANKLLKERLDPTGYFEVPHTPGLWRHITRPVQFTLVVDNFGVKFTGKEHTDHLVSDLNNNYRISTNWNGGLYCGITPQRD